MTATPEQRNELLEEMRKTDQQRAERIQKRMTDAGIENAAPALLGSTADNTPLAQTAQQNSRPWEDEAEWKKYASLANMLGR